ncbi:MAG: hypothetical protein EA416_01940 [Trueperaceae bacterium]|nr:MAG: hypothetical protein EA416_01940 [Trueperaceae bacterium]
MSAASLGTVRALPSSTWRTARWLVGNTLGILAVVAPLMLVLGVGVAPATMAYFGVQAPASLWSFAVEQAPGVFTLVIAAMTISQLATHLAFGMTRRSYAAAVVLSVVAIALLLALLVPLGYVLEAAHFRAYGWAHEAPDSLALALLTSVLRTAVWGLAGALTAAIWYRFGGFAGVVALPLTAIYPIVSAGMWIERADALGAPEAAMLVGLIALLGVAYAAVVAGIAVRARTA